VLNRYAGSYQLPEGQIVQIKNERGHLALSFGEGSQMALIYGGKPIITLYAASERDFYATAQFFNIHFENAPGKPPGFWLESYYEKQFVKKIK
jgi:hypothetical protein